MPLYVVKVVAKVEMEFELEADNLTDAKSEATAMVESGDMPNGYICDEVIKVYKPERQPD